MPSPIPTGVQVFPDYLRSRRCTHYDISVQAGIPGLLTTPDPPIGKIFYPDNVVIRHRPASYAAAVRSFERLQRGVPDLLTTPDPPNGKQYVPPAHFERVLNRVIGRLSAIRANADASPRNITLVMLRGQDKVYGDLGQSPTYDWQLALPSGWRTAKNHRINRFFYDHPSWELLSQDRIYGDPGQVPEYDWQTALPPKGYPRARSDVYTWLGQDALCSVRLPTIVKMLGPIDFLDPTRYQIIPAATVPSRALEEWYLSPSNYTVRFVFGVKCLGSNVETKLANMQALTAVLDLINNGTPVNYMEQHTETGHRLIVSVVDDFYEESDPVVLVALVFSSL